jgi:mRNA-degrading endonuclease RelE of RelBE toxin-antitoxin system
MILKNDIMNSSFKKEAEKIFQGYKLIIREQSKTREDNFSNSIIILSKTLKESNCEIIKLGHNGLNIASSPETPRSAIFVNLSLSDDDDKNKNININICNTHLFGG